MSNLCSFILTVHFADFYFESMKDRPDETYAPMNFYMELKKLPKFEDLRIIFGKQTNDRKCLQRCIHFIESIANNGASIRYDDIFSIKQHSTVG